MDRPHRHKPHSRWSSRPAGSATTLYCCPRYINPSHYT